MTRTATTATALLAMLVLAAPLAAQEPPAAPAAAPAAVTSPIPGYPDGKAATGPVKLEITAPREGEVIPMPPAEEGKPAPKGAEVVLRFEVKGYELFQVPEAKTGQYIQILLDGQMRGMHFLADKGWTLKNVPKGTHTVRAYLARPWHEAVKEPGAFAMVTFHVGEKDASVAPVEPGAPTLTLVRPRGKYKAAEAKKILFDVFVTGCTLSAEKSDSTCRVKYRLNEQPEAVLERWAPVFFENLPPGRHTLGAALSRNGKFFPGTAVSVAFEIEADSPAAAPAAPAAPAPGPGSGTPAP